VASGPCNGPRLVNYKGHARTSFPSILHPYACARACGNGQPSPETRLDVVHTTPTFTITCLRQIRSNVCGQRALGHDWLIIKDVLRSFPSITPPWSPGIASHRPKQGWSRANHSNPHNYLPRLRQVKCVWAAGPGPRLAEYKGHSRSFPSIIHSWGARIASPRLKRSWSRVHHCKYSQLLDSIRPMGLRQVKCMWPAGPGPQLASYN
jgi:hypothetical protein